MSWSLQLQHGDFTLSNGAIGTVTDESKLVQDLRCALLEHMGNDDMHPEFGSLLDGGVLPDGTVAPGAIGQLDTQAVIAQVQAEIQRISSNYQAQQLARAKTDRLIYNRVSLSAAEVLLSLSAIDFKQMQDTLQVQVTLSTARGQNLTIVFPLSTS